MEADQSNLATRIQPCKTFEELNLDKDLVLGINRAGFTKACVVQTKSIPVMLEKRDIILNSRSNSGKTTAFAISILQLIDRTSPTFQALIMTPNRTIGWILHRLLQYLSSYLDVGVEGCFGGITFNDQVKLFQQGKYQIVVGTPGRVEDMILQGYLKTDHLKILVIDESHEMIGIGAGEQIRSIMQRIPSKTQKMIMTSTIPLELHNIIESFLNEPVKLFVEDIAFFTGKIQQCYICVQKEEWKLDIIQEIYCNLHVLQSVIYCDSLVIFEDLERIFEKNNYTTISKIGSTKKKQKIWTFKQEGLNYRKIIITNDRTFLDVDLDSKVYFINYSLSMITNCEYTNMIEKIGVCNSTCLLINFVTPGEITILEEIKNKYKNEIKEMILDAWDFPQ